MFQEARTKLTAWYLLIIMLVSISFSIVIYRVLTNELHRIERVEQLRTTRGFPPPPFIDPDVLAETQNRIVLSLVAINLFILVGSAIAGYFLAGRTLQPIANMVDEQNQFVSDASHELRTPLTALKSEIEVNLRNKSLTVSDAKRLLESNLEEVNNLQTLSDNLMKLTQFQKGNNGLQVSPLKISTVIKEAVRRVNASARAKNMVITTSVPDLTLTGNATLLTELFIILLDNAIKYSARGKKIRIVAKKTDGHAAIQVSDQGHGIDSKDIPHLFDRFWRADKSRTKSMVTGYGLGLAIAKQIVDHHQGSVNVESIPEKGTTFNVRLPLHHSSSLM